MLEFTAHPVFGVGLTIFAFTLFQKLTKNVKTPLLHPMILSIAGIIFFLSLTGIPLENYERGGAILSFFLSPLIVALGIPLFKKRRELKANALPILIGVTVGSFSGLIVTHLLGRTLGFSTDLLLSLAPKHTTTAIAVELSSSFGGNPALTMAFVLAAGTIGIIAGPFVLKVLRIKNPTAKGIGLGTASHAFGTTKAMELGEEEGAMSSLAIGLAGLINTLLIPIVLHFFL